MLTEAVTAFPCNWSAWQVGSGTTSWSVGVVAACAACLDCQSSVSSAAGREAASALQLAHRC